jgi:ABC-type antimicrobial peptide transport system permease subunit
MPYMERAGIIGVFLGWFVLLCLAGAVAFKSCADAEGTECEEYSEQRACREPASISRSVYFAVQTITTVGYGSSLEMASSRVRCVAIVFMVLGATSFAVVTGVIAGTIIGAAKLSRLCFKRGINAYHHIG